MAERVLLKIGDSGPVPPTGHKSLVLDVDGEPFLLNSDGTTDEIGGGGTVESATSPLIITDGVLATNYALLNEVITASGTVTNIDLAPAGWTLNGDTDGEYELIGQINTPAASQSFNYTFEPNALATNQLGRVAIAQSNNAFLSAAVTTLYISAGTTNAGRITFRVSFSAKSGRIRQYICRSRWYDATAGTQQLYVVEGEWNSTATVVGPTSRIHCDNANGILTGSFVKIIRNLMTA